MSSSYDIMRFLSGRTVESVPVMGVRSWARRQGQLGKPGKVTELYGNLSAKELCRLSEQNKLPPKVIEELSRHEDPDVRIAIAENPDTPCAIVWFLAQDENPDVRYALAENHNMPALILDILSQDANPYVAWRATKTINRVRGCSPVS